MSPSLVQRIALYAKANRHRRVWKRRLYALAWGAGLTRLSRIKD